MQQQSQLEVPELKQTPRPIPKFFDDDRPAFSTKKNRKVERRCAPNRTAPPLSRVYPRRFANQPPQFISFKSPNASYLDKWQGQSPPMSASYDASKQETFLDQAFKIEAKIGEGSFGQVFRARSKQDGRLYAVKRALEKFRSQSDRAAKLREVQKHEGLPSHPNLVSFVAAWEESGLLYIQTELCRSSLDQFCQHNHRLPESLIWKYLVDLLQAVQHLHDNSLLHMDIKPENIFISHDDICKLGDFGLVYDLRQPVETAQEGDAKYLAPELLHTSPTKSSDMFSLGMTMLEVACDLDLPIHGEPWQMLRRGKLPQEHLFRLSPALQDVIAAMMSPLPAERPSAAALLARCRAEGHLTQRRLYTHYRSLTHRFSSFWLRFCALFAVLFMALLHPILYLTRSSQTEDPPRRRPPTPDSAPAQPLESPFKFPHSLNFDTSSDSDEDEMESIGNVSSIQGNAQELHEGTDSDSLSPPHPRLPFRPFNSTPAANGRKRARLSHTAPKLYHIDDSVRIDGAGDASWRSPSSSSLRSPRLPPSGDSRGSRVSPRKLKLAFDHHGSSSEDELMY